MLWYRPLAVVRTFELECFGYILMCLASLANTVAEHAKDQCEHTIWDNTAEPKGVRNIYAYCSEGHISWKHPYGAVRITLQLGSPDSNSAPLVGCIKAYGQFTIAQISLENGEDLRSLATLNFGNPETKREICLESQSGVINLYIEAQPTDLNSVTIGEVSVDYDLQRKAPKPSQDSLEECRPCTEMELLTAFCSSDFVVQGSIGDITHDTTASETQVGVKVGKIHRQKTLIFKRNTSRGRRRKGLYFGSVFGPYKCGIQHGDGLFIFMGRIRLNRAILRCAPRLEEFQTLWRRASEEGRAPCASD